MKQINDKLLKDYVEKARSAGRISFGYKDVQSTLRKLKLVREKKILKAAEVLFSDDNSLEMQAAVFAGTDKTTFIDIKVFKGTIFDILKQSEEYISEKMNWRVEFRDFKRVEIPEIPTNAIREAVVNSLCHRDYFRADANKIAIFKDRITIYNPGEFPSGVEPQDFIMETADSMQRNPLIAEIMYYSKDIERWGTGIKRIHDECAKNSVKVDFKRCKGGFSVVFYRKTYPEDTVKVTPKVTEMVTVKVTANQEKILGLIKANPHATATEMAKAVGISERKIKENLKKLKVLGRLRRIGPDKGGHWEITETTTGT
jgi:ATP-dependent DNA helicase RecG